MSAKRPRALDDFLPVTIRWVDRSGDLRDGLGPRAKFIAYKTITGVMVAGSRTADELRAIAHWIDECTLHS